jgi:ribonuclease R
VELVKYENWRAPAHIKIKKVLGKVGDNETEMKAAVYDRGLVMGFPKEVEAAAAKLKERAPKMIADEIPNRKDLRDLDVFTIDPADAKDFDDAISVDYLDNGNYRVGVHIADPTFFVKPGDIIDKEAAERATSIYLVDRIIPMLPEVLSNDLCSLNPNEDKMAFSLIFELDQEANIINE